MLFVWAEESVGGYGLLRIVVAVLSRITTEALPIVDDSRRLAERTTTLTGIDAR